MAGVTISLPDDLLVRVDQQANTLGSTRDATIRELAEVGLGERQRRLSDRMATLGASARWHDGNPLADLTAGPLK
jgi:metal-responsive CopG/Arc/MetJ family transcriptional regulator